MLSNGITKFFLVFVLPGYFFLDARAQDECNPVIGTVTQPTCATATGSVELSGLPDLWTLTIAGTSSGVSTRTGSGATTTVDELTPDSYTFIVTSEGCTSDPSGVVTINQQPATPMPPDVGTVTQPTCTVSTGSVVVNGLPTGGEWTLTRYPGEVTVNGTGSSATISGLAPGTYSFAVTFQSCISEISDEAVINQAPVTPAPPEIGTITQPTCEVSTGSVVVNGLPTGGEWTLTRYPGEVTVNGTGSSATISGLAPGTYSFAVTFQGCISEISDEAVINQAPVTPAPPEIGTITQPACEVSTGSIMLNGLPAAGSWTLIRLPGNVTITGSGSSVTIPDLSPGNYRFRVTNSAGCTSALSEQAVINPQPEIPAAPVHTIDCFFGNGLAIITVASPVRPGYQYRLDDGPFNTTGRFVSVGNGNHTITVRSADGCLTTGDEFAVSCGCVDRPSVTLISRTGVACGTTPVTISGNTFGGSATSVTITADGAGSVSTGTVNSSPFAFTYTPAAGDIGNIVTITFTTNNPLGEPCEPATTTFTLTVNPVPGAPVPGEITHPTCTSSTGSVVLSDLPATGVWSLVRTPGNITIQGSGATTTVSGLESGTYTFTVAQNLCSSVPSAAITVNPLPLIPEVPVAAGVIHPECTVATGTVNLDGLPANGTWILTRYPGTVTTAGTGTSTSITLLAPGTYNFTVTSASGCTSALSANIVVNNQPPTPSAPVTGAITAPTCTQPLGSVVLTGLPAAGEWTIESETGGVTLSGNGTSVTVRGLIPGAYSFTVTNSAGCTSASGGIVVIPSIPGAPVLTITDPLPVCAPATVDITAPAITAGSTPGITLTYWRNAAGTTEFTTPEAATNGTYYIRATNESQCSDIKLVNVFVLNAPSADAGPDQVLNYVFTSSTEASLPGPGETGSWSVYAGSGRFANPSEPLTTVSELGTGENIFLWKVTNGVCPEAADTLKITVNDLTVPTLITPNGDGINDYFILSGIEHQTGNELMIFDRRGVMVFKDDDYANDWNGLDYNGRPLAEDTYFYVIRAGGRQRTGFIVIRR